MLKNILGNRITRLSVATILIIIVGLAYVLYPVQVSVSSGGYLSFNIETPQVKAAAVVTPLGTFTDKSSTNPLTLISSLTLVEGDALIVLVANDPTAYDAISYGRVYWGGTSVPSIAVSINSGQVSIRMCGLYVLAGGADTRDLTVNWDARDVPVASAESVYKVTGLAHTSWISGFDTPELDKTSTATGSSTTPSSGATATLTQADELIIGCIGVEDEIDDMGGTWTTGAGYVSGNEQQTGTNGAGDASNITIYSAAEIVSATTAQTAAMTGIDDTDWAAGVITLKIEVSAADISNSPSSKAFGTVQPSTTYWSNGSEPTWALVDGDAFFTITNNGATCSITVSATNFTGGVGWTLTSGSPGSNTVRMTAFKEGDGSGDGVALTTSPQAFISALSTNIDWELKVETGTFTDGALKTSTITLAATLD